MSREYAPNRQSHINQPDQQVSEPPANTGHLRYDWPIHSPWFYHPETPLQYSEHDQSLTPGSTYERTYMHLEYYGQYPPLVLEDGEQTPRADTPCAYTLAMGTPRVDTPEAASFLDVTPTPRQITSSYHDPHASVQETYQDSPDEVVSVVQRWFSNKWLDKLAVINEALGWELSCQAIRSTFYNAKRNQNPGWAKVYTVNFNESSRWGNLLERMVQTGQRLGIDMRLRQQEYQPNIPAHKRHRAQDHRWTDERKAVLCLLRIAYPESSHAKVHHIMHNIFPNMSTSVSAIRERFGRMMREGDPILLHMKGLTSDQREDEYRDGLRRTRAAALKLVTELL
ncbi:MAG: hypothetical protein M1840_008461 [Geoglossum simile]|nr:MAG: hypothetical protein M1840_008461 [Geoglossum simile]